MAASALWKYILASDLYFSWPAVSQSWILTMSYSSGPLKGFSGLLITMSLLLKDPVTVASVFDLKSFYANLCNKDVLPTFVSPINTTFLFIILFPFRLALIGLFWMCAVLNYISETGSAGDWTCCLISCICWSELSNSKQPYVRPSMTFLFYC